MMKRLMLWVGVSFFSVFSGQALAVDSAMITLLQGKVSLLNEAQVDVSAFMKMRPGDKLQTSPDSVVQLVYFANGRQETWRGNALLEIGEEKTQYNKMAFPPEVKQLSNLLIQQLKKTPSSDSRGQVGMVRMRAISTPGALAKLEDNYKDLRQASAADDLNPELYLFAGLFELKEFARLQGALVDLDLRYKDNEVAKEIHAHYAKAILEVQAK